MQKLPTQTEPNPQDDQHSSSGSGPSAKDGIDQSKVSSDQVSAQEIMGLDNLEMGQLREQLRLKGLPLSKSTLEVRVIPDVQADVASPSLRKLQLDKTDL